MKRTNQDKRREENKPLKLKFTLSQPFPIWCTTHSLSATCQVGYALQINEVIHLKIIQSARSSNDNIHTFGHHVYLSFSVPTTIYTNTGKENIFQKQCIKIQLISIFPQQNATMLLHFKKNHLQLLRRPQRDCF